MCPITLPDERALWLEGIDALTEIHGDGNFSSYDVAEWVDVRVKLHWAEWLTNYEAEIDCLEPGELHA